MGTLKEPLNASTARNIRDKLHRSWLDKDWDVLPDLITEDVHIIFTSIGVNQKHDGLSWLKDVFGQYADAFPDMTLTVHKECFNEKCLWNEVSWSGTHLGKLGSIEPTKKRITDRIFVEVLEFNDDGKICAVKQYQDGNSLYIQLGVSGLTLPPLVCDPDEVMALRKSLCGDVLTPNSPNYVSQALMANSDIPSVPSVLIQCVGVSDVIKAIAFCKDFEARNPTAPRTAIRSGGHSFSGVSTNVGGCVIDLRRMRSVLVDEDEQTCWVDGGALAQDLDREVFAHGGFVVPNGQVSNTGVGGLASGGGYGLLTHRLGLMIDNLIECEIVLADGSITRCSKKKHPELFWAVKGGARWLGVVTKFKFKLTKLGKPTSNSIMMFEANLFEECFRASRKLTEKQAFAFVAIASPAELGGKTICLVHLTVLDGLAHANEVQDFFLREVGSQPIVQFLPLQERPWPEINSAIDFVWPYGVRVYAKGFELSNDEEKGVRFLKKFLEMRPANASIGLDWNTGEYSRIHDVVNEDDLGFLQRREPVYVGLVIVYLTDEQDKAESRMFCRQFLEATKDLRNEHPQYVNFGEEHGLEKRTSKEVSDRFWRIKQQVDPDCFFGKDF